MQRMDALLDKLSASVASAKTVEDLTRPLLELLESVTELESVYLTTIDLDRGLQRILFARNSGRLQIPEGLEVAWEDTLCKRALDSGQLMTSDVGSCWGDSAAASALGLVTYMSAPVRFNDGALFGTLCAAGSTRHTPDESSVRLLTLFASLISFQVEREALVKKLISANQVLESYALTDPLTKLPNRRALLDALERLIANGVRRNQRVFVAVIDLDQFKEINDQYGHDIGDQFLVEVSKRIQAALRTEDMVARFGGDEFVVIAPGPSAVESLPEALNAFSRRLSNSVVGNYLLGESIEIQYAGASLGVTAVEPGEMDGLGAIKQADQQMYEAKRQRRSAN
jgi:diguanylate cyclase